jgi:hypothetical protein
MNGMLPSEITPQKWMVVNKYLKIFKPTKASLTNKVNTISLLEISNINPMIMCWDKCEEICIMRT